MEKKYKIVFSFGLIIIFLSIISILHYVGEGNSMNNLNNLYKDIAILDEAISMYYLDNSNIPVIEKNIDFKEIYNVNDNLVYYEIDLEKIGNLNLTFGNKKYGEDDIYIINDNSHTIYYLKGVSYHHKKYYTRENIQYDYIDLENYK